jgi:hypothetical protein
MREKKTMAPRICMPALMRCGLTTLSTSPTTTNPQAQRKAAR